VESTQAGIVLQLLFQPGDEAAVFKPIAYIGQKNESPVDPGESLSTPAVYDEKKHKESLVRAEDKRSEGLFSSPSARRIARENNLDLSPITGTGPHGRIIKKDVQLFLSLRKQEKKITPVAKKIAEDGGIPVDSIQGTGFGGRVMKKDVVSSFGQVKSAVLKESPGDQVILYSKARKRTAERLSFSKLTIPHYYLFAEVDVTTILAWRKTTNLKLGVKISINDIIIKSTGEALKEFPELNAWVDDDKMLIKPEINIGVAVSTENGLLVPVIPETDKLNLMEISNISLKNAEDAHRGIIRMDKPGTFTVSNLGMYGVSRFLPIINPPECAILSVGAVEKKVIPKEDTLAIIDNLTLGLACDHRAVDGAKASEFLRFLKETIESFGK
jgi:pyruvate dehydrogenase E2 component (dihydrolipoamide acetyltransferase)